MSATYADLLKYLLELQANHDNRLQDTITVYNSIDGEYYPAEFLEFDGDNILDDGHIFIAAYNWGENLEEFDEESPE